MYVNLFLLLAAFAAVFAVIILALLILMQLQLIPFVALFETIVALLGIFLTTISGREPPLQLWLSHRRRAEQLRREYFRYLFRLPPYDRLVGVERGLKLSERAADINRGVFPENSHCWIYKFISRVA
ncbi:MAG: DUF4231 domain-containing protein [Chloroflexi bacterium]|uniref:DUF4231 domain-containing protein n=1 Tax=Candidatus Flexifilum breve TaxID=3140694 RepID=UPI0031368984|nr:DUF4231 domain-containing protein [Chloroflexota bacterium]